MATINKAVARLSQLSKFRQWLQELDKDARWCILINADPDALASALALKRILCHRTSHVHIASINDITRPDNLAMIRYVRIPVEPWTPDLRAACTHFALVDSQPHHSPQLEDVSFDVVIDHHPLVAQHPVHAPFTDIRPELGATSTILTRYLRGLAITPGRLLATALLYGIRTDTAAFERSGVDKDFQAYQWLSRHADTALLRRILRSEYLIEWLPVFSRAFLSLHTFKQGAHASINEVSSPDLLVAVADFFTRVHGLKWVAVSGVYGATVVVIFRGDGGRDMGRFAVQRFGDIGSAGGHRTLARAEFPLDAVGTLQAGDFVRARLEGLKGLG